MMRRNIRMKAEGKRTRPRARKTAPEAGGRGAFPVSGLVGGHPYAFR
jgi:hypothetical protein